MSLGFLTPMMITSTPTRQSVGASVFNNNLLRHYHHSLVPIRRVSVLCMSKGDSKNGATDPSIETDPAILSGDKMRAELNRLSSERQALAERTQQNLKNMSESISQLMAEVREEIGMPPVSDLPGNETTPTPAENNNINTSTSNNVKSTSTNTNTSSSEDSTTSTDEPYMDPKNFGYESTAGWQVLAESLQLPDNEGKVEMRIKCDINGCSLIELKEDDEMSDNDINSTSGVRTQFIQSGIGYRIGYDPKAPKSCCALIGGDSWVVALSFDEMRHFKRLCLALQKRMDRIAAREEDMPAKDAVVLRRSADGLFNMRISRAGLDCSVEHESKLLWAQAIGQPVMGQYCIRAILMDGRKSELYWAPDYVSNLFAALNKLRIE